MNSLSTGAAARELGTSEPRLQQLIRFGKMPRPRVVNGKRVWTKKDLDAAKMALARN